MKIYINEQHQIKSVAFNDTEEALEEIEVEDSFLSQFCDTAKKGFCYHRWTQEDGSECLSIYPYKDLTMLMTIQEQYEADQETITELQLALADQYEQNTKLEELLTDTQLAITQLYEGGAA